MALLQRILAMLPVEFILSVRLVCRELRHITTCPAFQEQWREANRSREAAPFLIRPSASLKKWCNLPNACFLPEGGFHLKGASGGLVAARLKSKIAVGNPITGQWVFFDPAPNSSWETSPWSLLVPKRSPASGGRTALDFRIIIGDCFYNSRTRRWKTVDFPGNSSYGSLFCDGIATFYYLCSEDNGVVKLVSGSMNDPSNVEVLGSWSEDRFKYPLYHQLLIYKGGEVGLLRDSSKVVRGIDAFVFDPVGREWRRRPSLPSEMVKRVMSEQKGVKLLPKHELWQFSGDQGGRINFVAPHHCSGIIVFDSWDESWSWVDDPAPVPSFGRRSEFFSMELAI
ncbi:hypothetical protein SELMODRAFT_402577 [Selaginella moellendorffii]|uniref:F-box domain-containing protein n=1 Tax=Selaginella moellendorffii TaxID=88036 RepID=D8QR44_SELML|nr:hypothetical protein SELMODRAFT_402577 [Selaginella moellendorffii]